MFLDKGQRMISLVAVRGSRVRHEYHQQAITSNIVLWTMIDGDE